MSSSDLLSRSVGHAVVVALAWCALGDPAAGQNGSWHSSTALPDPRRLMAAAAIGETIYTFGGCGSPCFAPPLHTSTFEETRVEVYAAGAWSARAPIPEVFFGGAAAAARVDGKTKIYLFGGFVTGGSTLAYDPERDSWEPRAPMPTPRHGLAAVAVNGKIYVLGGSNGTNAVAALEVYDPVHDTWEQLAPMPTARVFLAATAFGGRIYAIGGSPDCCGSGTSNNVEVYDTVQRSWSPDPSRPVPSLPEALQTSAAATFGGKIYVLGGFVPGHGATGSTYELDPAAPQLTWTAKLPMPEPRDQAPAVALADGIHILGGSTNCHCSPRRDHPIFDPETPDVDNDLDIVKTVDVLDACPGETVTYTVTVTNDGPADAHGATVSDPAPGSDNPFATTRLRGATWTCQPSPGAACATADHQPGTSHPTPIHDLVDLPAGGRITYTVSGTLDFDASGTISNEAQVQSSDGVVIRSAASTVIRRDRLEIVKTEVPPQELVCPQDLVLYKIVVTNRCRISLPVTVTDDLSDAGLTDPRWCRGEGCDPSTPGKLLDRVTVPAGGSASFMASGTVPCSAATPPSSLHNVAFASAPGQASVSATLSTPTGDDQLQVAIAGPGVLDGSGALDSCSGEYAITVTNLGSCPATDVVLEVPVPPSLDLVSLSAPCAAGSPCVIPSIPSEVTVKAQFKATDGLQCPIAPQSISATARSFCHPPHEPPAAASLAVEIPCDLAITKTDDLATAAPGDCTTYTIQVENAGCGAVSGAKVFDQFPPELEDVVTCIGMPCAPAPINSGTLPVLLPGQTASFQVGATISPQFVGTLSNTASVVTSAGVDSQPANDTSTDVTTVVPDPGIAALCAATESPVLEGDVVTFTFVLWNGGPAAQADNPGDEFVDALPAGLTLVSAAASSGTISTLGNTVSWNGAIPVGGMVTIDVDASVDVGTIGMTICNVATVFFDADGDGINESSAPSDGCHPCCVEPVAEPMIPTLSTLAMAALAVLLAALAWARLRAA